MIKENEKKVNEIKVDLIDMIGLYRLEFSFLDNLFALFHF
jgi:hypothetical protein